MKFIFFLAFSLVFITSPKLSEVRSSYAMAIDSEEKTKLLHRELEAVTESDMAILRAYKGAVSTMMAKYTRKKGEKLDFFKSGVALMEAAIAEDSSNIEMRTIRLGIQENAPKFLRYHKNKEEDKLYIIDNFSKIQQKEIKSFVRTFVQQSAEFSEAEKASFQ